MAHKFTDSKRRDWSVVITGQTLSEAAQAGVDLDLSALIEAARSQDPARLLSIRFVGGMLDLCWLGCRFNSRAASGKIDAEDFKASLSGASLLAAVMATAGALCECFGLEAADVADPTPAGNPAEA